MPKNLPVGAIFVQAGMQPGISWPGCWAPSSDTESSITFSSGLRFRWSWARWNRNKEPFKNMQRNIIVHHLRIKPNGERWDLLIKEQPIKPPNQNTIWFSSGLRFLRSWACIEDTHKLYKIMHIHIIVHHVMRKAQVESLTSLREDEPIKPQWSKTL